MHTILFFFLLNIIHLPANANNVREFLDEDRYFPSFMSQYNNLNFLWEDFFTFRHDFWGDNSSGNMLIQNSINKRTYHISGKTIENNSLVLKKNQMVWSLDRLGFGVVEFRSVYFFKPFSKTSGEKWFGFGDPGEGFALGYRLINKNNSSFIFLESINYGQLNKIQLPWKDEYANGRFFVIRKNNSARFIIILSDSRFINLGSLSDLNDNEVIPKIKLEISMHNLKGSPFLFDLIKFDSTQ